MKMGTTCVPIQNRNHLLPFSALDGFVSTGPPLPMDSQASEQRLINPTPFFKGDILLGANNDMIEKFDSNNFAGL